MKATFSFLIFAGLIFCFGLTETFACSCVSADSVCGVLSKIKNKNYDKTVFVGTVDSIEKVKIFDDEENEYIHFDKIFFEISEIFSGKIGQKEFVYTFSDGTSCGYLFEVGKSYLVYSAYNEDFKIFGTSLCSATKEFDSAKNEISVLRSLMNDGKVEPNIFGTVNVINAKSNEKKLFKVTAQKEGGNTRIEKSVESGKSFNFSNLQFGKYWFTVFVENVSFKISKPIELNENNVCSELEISISDSELKGLQNLK